MSLLPEHPMAPLPTPAHAPLVTVILCTYNGGELLGPALRSVLGQTYPHIEVLLVDDGSTDGSVEQLRCEIDDVRVRWIRQPQSGRAAALNRALDEASGEFYTTQDADDESYPDRIARQVTCLCEHPGLAAVFCGFDLILGGRRLAPAFEERDVAACRHAIDAYAMPGHDPTAMYRMAYVAGMRYETSLKVGAAYDYVLRVGEKHRMAVLGEVLYSYRVDSDGVTRKDPARRIGFVKEVRRRAMQRRGESLEGLDRLPAFQVRRRWRNRDLDNNLAARFIDSVHALRAAGRWREAARTGLGSAAMHPLDLHYYKALAYALMPLPLVRCVRGMRSNRTVKR